MRFLYKWTISYLAHFPVNSKDYSLEFGIEIEYKLIGSFSNEKEIIGNTFGLKNRL